MLKLFKGVRLEGVVEAACLDILRVHPGVEGVAARLDEHRQRAVPTSRLRNHVFCKNLFSLLKKSDQVVRALDPQRRDASEPVGRGPASEGRPGRRAQVEVVRRLGAPGHAQVGRAAPPPVHDVDRDGPPLVGEADAGTADQTTVIVVLAVGSKICLNYAM